MIIYHDEGFPGGASGKESISQCRRLMRWGFDSGPGRSPGERHGNPLQYSCLKSPMDRKAWWASVLEVTKNQSRLKWLGMHAHITWIEGFISRVQEWVNICNSTCYTPFTKNDKICIHLNKLKKIEKFKSIYDKYSYPSRLGRMCFNIIWLYMTNHS